MVRLLASILFICLHHVTCAQYNYYYGNLHAHSSYSDGNKDSLISFLTTPLQNFNYAKASQRIDFYGISEHNHQSAGMLAPIYYHYGLADADTATTNGNFVALYGMEWGTISEGGHVLIYGYDSLIGWDVNDYDVYVDKGDFLSLWRKINEKPNAFAYFAHPQTTDYLNLFNTTYNKQADSAIVGMAARSGPAFSTNTTYSDPPSSNYISRYNDALKRGYHLGVGLDHDTHFSVFGRSTQGRLVVLANSLTRANIIDAMKQMRFYSSDDWNTEVDFQINNQPMGSIITSTATAIMTVTVTDSDSNDPVSTINVYSGIAGSGTNPTLLTSSSSNLINYVVNTTDTLEHYYYLRITQTDGDIIWTSPIWYTKKEQVTTGLEDFNHSTFRLYPNPAKEFVTVDVSEFKGSKSILIYNEMGTLLDEYIISGTEQRINTQLYPSGIYFIQVLGSGEKQNLKKLLIVH